MITFLEAVDGENEIHNLLKKTRFDSVRNHLRKEDDGSYIICKVSDRGLIIDNEYGPAIITKSGYQLYFINGNQLTGGKLNEKLKQMENDPNKKSVVTIFDFMKKNISDAQLVSSNEFK